MSVWYGGPLLLILANLSYASSSSHFKNAGHDINILSHRILQNLPTVKKYNPFPEFLTDYESFNQSINENMSQVGYTVLVNIVFAVLFLCIFSYNRIRNAKLFAPKANIKGERCPPLLTNLNMYSWMRELWNISDDVIFENGGFDALTFIRFYRLNCKIFAVFAIYAILVLLPVNGTAPTEDNSVDSFQRWSMTNIKQQSSLCWFHLFGIFLLTAITVYYLEMEFVFYAKQRHAYLRQRHAHLRTVLVEGIPKKMRSCKTLALYFEVLYPNAVQQVRLAQDIRKLETTVNDRSRALRKLEMHLYQYYSDQIIAGEDVSAHKRDQHVGSRQDTKVRPQLLVGNELVDAIKHYSHLVSKFNEIVASEQLKARSLAAKVDQMNHKQSVYVIEGLLRVTEMGTLDSLLRQLGNNFSEVGRNVGNVQPIQVRGTNAGYGGTGITRLKSNNTDKDSPLNAIAGEIKVQDYDKFVKDYGDDSSDDDITYVGNEMRPGNVVQLRYSFKEWMYAIWRADSLSAKVDHFLDGPFKQVEDDADEESVNLIRPLHERKLFLPKAFVTFKTFTAATIARQVIHVQLAGHLAVSEAPEPRDVRWHNMYLNRRGFLIRAFFIECFVVCLIVFWVVPITLLSHVTGLVYLQKVPWIKSICTNSPLLRSLLGLLQPATMVGLMQLLPPLFQALGDLQGCVSFSKIQFLSFDRYFLFQVINIFLVTTVAGSVADAVATVLTSPANAFTLLGMSLPKMGGYFTTFIIIKAFFGLGMEIIRLPDMLLSVGKSMFYNNITLRERKEKNFFGAFRFMDNPHGLDFAKVYAQDVLIAVLCATFANIAPLLIVAGVIYFGTSGLVYTHQLLYVYVSEYETGGRWWSKISKCMVSALLFAQFTMIGMMILKSTYTQIYFMVLLVAFTIFYLWRLNTYYVPIGKHLPFDIAAAMDLDKDFVDGEEMQGEEDYMQPELRPVSTYETELVDIYVPPEDRVPIAV